jgi:hypothetical protein
MGTVEIGRDAKSSGVAAVMPERDSTTGQKEGALVTIRISEVESGIIQSSSLGKQDFGARP